MPIDASIPLQVQQYQAPDVMGMTGKALQLQGLQQENQARQLALDERKAEVEAFKGADFSTAEGRNAALVDIMQKAPQVGMKLMKQFSDLDKNAAQAKHFTAQAGLDVLKTQEGKQKVIAEAATPAWNAYQRALKEGKPEQLARAEADKLMPSALAQVQSSGVFNQDEMAAIPRTFDPNVVGGALMTTGIYSKMIQDRLHEAQTTSAEATTKLHTEQAEHPEKFHAARETGAQILEDKDGNVFSVNPNKPDEGVKPVAGAKGLHKPGTTGGAAAQKANIRATSVAAAANNSLRILDQISKEFGDKATTSVIFKEDPKGAVGTFFTGAAKRLVPEKTLKLDADANSLIDEAGPAFTGGLRVNSSFREFLRNQLPSFGDPDKVAQRKWKNFRENVQGSSDTFKKAYTGDPNYWSKDAEGKTVNPATDPDYLTPKAAGKGETAAPKEQAPQSAIDYLKANPKLKDAFKQKYGYLPEGM